MFGIGTGELLLLLLIALLVLGPERMPKLARDLGKTMGDLRKTSEELQKEFLNADRTLNAEKMLGVATAVTDARPAETPAPAAKGSGEAAAEKNEVTGTAAEVGASMGESAPPDVAATQAEVVPPIQEGPDETVFDREARLARERIDRAADM